MGIFSLITGRRGPSGFGSASTAKEVTQNLDASHLTAIITGGASGIGEETARVLALRGAHVIIAVRNTDAGQASKARILEANPSSRVEVLKLDLCATRSVKEFAQAFLAMGLPLNILINNAGVMFCPFQLSEDGIETQFATNHLGHFLLTNLLLEKMKATAKGTGIEGRIVNLSSIAHHRPYPGGILFDAINERSRYSDKMAYGQSKLANILHAFELSRRLQEEGVTISVNAVHPGVIMTNLMRHSMFLMSTLRRFMMKPPRALRVVTYLMWKNVPQRGEMIQGAATTCYVALHPALKGVTGKYFQDCNETQPSALARDGKLAKKLWDFSEKLVQSAP